MNIHLRKFSKLFRIAKLRKVERNAKEMLAFLFISETKDSKLISLGSSKNFGVSQSYEKSL